MEKLLGMLMYNYVRDLLLQNSGFEKAYYFITSKHLILQKINVVVKRRIHSPNKDK